MKSYIAHRVQSFSSSEIMDFFTKTKGIENAIDLSVGIPYGEMTMEAQDAAIDALMLGKTRYIQAGGMNSLRTSLAKKLRERNQIDATHETTIVTAGVSAGLFLAMAAVINPGDEIVIPDPFFLAYRELAVLLDAKPIFLNTYPDFALNIERLDQLITPKTKAIMINSPNNPTGSIYDQKTLEALADLCKKHDLVVISDEIYEDFVYSEKHFSIGSIYQPTITLNGFSKNHAMTGLRVGYAHSTPEIIQAMIELEQFVFFSNSSVAEYAAEAALSVPTKNRIAFYAKNRQLVINTLDPHYVRSFGDGCFFFFIQHPDLDGRELAEKALSKGLIVIPGDLFSEKKSHFRISFATSYDSLKEGINILNSLL